ncbi:hypothetical protein [Nonomuraea jabiensis]|uniref:hypothetical protein n=1 Tax=Nonomuraea jabiensis TaxID=882448 RepID=UPI0036C50125
MSASTRDVVKRELEIIRDDLHRTTVRVIGGDPERLELAATYAADLGLEVWFSPYPLELTTAGTPTPTCSGNPRLPSPPSPSTTAADHVAKTAPPACRTGRALHPSCPFCGRTKEYT